MPEASPSQPMTIGVVRFAIELAAWSGAALLGWTLGDGGVTGTILAVLLFAAAIAVWGVFGVPGDLARNPNPPVAVPGRLRLAIEFAIIGVGAWGIWAFGYRGWAETLLTVAALTYFLTYDRVAWLVTGRAVQGFQRKDTE